MVFTKSPIEEVKIELCFCKKSTERLNGDIVEVTIVCKACLAKEMKEVEADAVE